MEKLKSTLVQSHIDFVPITTAFICKSTRLKSALFEEVSKEISETWTHSFLSTHKLN